MVEVAPSSSYSGKISQKSEGFWLLNLDMIESQSGRIIEKLYVSEKEIGQSTVAFSENNILFSKLRPYLNKIAIPDETGFASSELVPLLPDKDFLNPLFFAQLLRGNEFLSFISSQVSGTKMPRVSMDVFWNFEVFLPPLNLQKEYAEFVQLLDKSKYAGCWIENRAAA